MAHNNRTPYFLQAKQIPRVKENDDSPILVADVFKRKEVDAPDWGRRCEFVQSNPPQQSTPPMNTPPEHPPMNIGLSLAALFQVAQRTQCFLNLQVCEYFSQHIHSVR